MGIYVRILFQHHWPSFMLLSRDTYLQYEQQRQKTYLRTCAPSENSDQPAHSRSLIRIFLCAFWITKYATFLHTDNDADTYAEWSLRWSIKSKDMFSHVADHVFIIL